MTLLPEYLDSYQRRLRRVEASVGGAVSEDAATDFQDAFLSRQPHLDPLFRAVVKGTVAAHARGTEVASFERGRIVLKPEFFAHMERYGVPAADWVYAHELGHAVESHIGLAEWTRKAAEMGIDVWDASALPHGQVKMDEAFAETFAVLAMRDADGMRMLARRWPAWAELVEWAAESVGVKLSVGGGRS